MKLYSEKENCYKLYHGNMLDMAEVIEPNSIDSIVTDPPYELNFMNKGWDNSGVAFQPNTWKKCYDVLKPGGYLLAFGGSRTFHRIAVAIEDAGFEIRDTIMWLYGSGFPKSLNIGKGIEAKLTTGSANTQEFKNLNDTKVESGNLGFSKNQFEQGARPSDYGADGHLRTDKVEYTTEEGKQWDGWGTALKPSYEPIIVARKPVDGSITDNVLKNGVGGINIDECRVDAETNRRMCGITEKSGETSFILGAREETYTNKGRFPANIILTYDESTYDEVCGNMPYTKNSGAPLTMPDLRDVGKKSKEAIGIDKLSFGQVSGAKRKPYVYAGREYNNKDTSMFNGDKPQAPSNYNDDGSASRYFYCAKASKKDRDEGLEEFEEKTAGERTNRKEGSAGINAYAGATGKARNIHPTVKPTNLMQYLIRLVTPNGGTILDPFNGSGSTGKAVMYENKERNKNYQYVGIELTEEYLPISKARIEYVIGIQTIPMVTLTGQTVTAMTNKPTPQPKKNILF